MEVHAHSHTPPDPSTSSGHRDKRKKWTHYFWEFLMLFLAVFCGFFAEYQLEHKIEKDRARQFAESLVRDLESDVKTLDSIMVVRKFRVACTDSLRRTLIDKSYKTNGANVYFWARGASRRAFFYSADGTMQQLKNSGGLRLINRQLVKDKISEYDVEYRTLISFDALEESLLLDYRRNISRLFDAGLLLTMTNTVDTLKTQLPQGNPQLLDDSPMAVNELANRLTFVYSVSSVILGRLIIQKKKAQDLIMLIKKEYRLG